MIIHVRRAPRVGKHNERQYKCSPGCNVMATFREVQTNRINPTDNPGRREARSDEPGARALIQKPRRGPGCTRSGPAGGAEAGSGALCWPRGVIRGSVCGVEPSASADGGTFNVCKICEHDTRSCQPRTGRRPLPSHQSIRTSFSVLRPFQSHFLLPNTTSSPHPLPSVPPFLSLHQ